MTNEPRLTVVVVTYASERTVGNALSALRPGCDRGLLRCIVVDNRSPDGTADLVAREHPWASLIRSPHNLGYGKGCNLGFEGVRTPYVLFMNPDVVIEPEAISTLIEFLDDRPEAGIAAPSTSLTSGGVQHAGGVPTPRLILAEAAGLQGVRARRAAVLPDGDPFATDWLCGAVMLMRSDLFRAVGGFDPRFFLYFEETDLCVRVRRAGHQLWAVGKAGARHAPGSSARDVDPALRPGECLSEHFFRSRYYYLAKHHGPLAAAATEALELVLKGVRDFVRVLVRGSSRKELRTRLQAPVFSAPSKQS